MAPLVAKPMTFPRMDQPWLVLARQASAPKRFSGHKKTGWSAWEICRVATFIALPMMFPRMDPLWLAKVSQTPALERLSGHKKTAWSNLEFSQARGTSVSAHDVSADGSIVVGNSLSREAFLWTKEDGMVGLGDLPGGSF